MKKTSGEKRENKEEREGDPPLTSRSPSTPVASQCAAAPMASAAPPALRSSPPMRLVALRATPTVARRPRSRRHELAAPEPPAHSPAPRARRRPLHLWI